MELSSSQSKGDVNKNGNRCFTKQLWKILVGAEGSLLHSMLHRVAQVRIVLQKTAQNWVSHQEQWPSALAASYSGRLSTNADAWAPPKDFLIQCVGLGPHMGISEKTLLDDSIVQRGLANIRLKGDISQGQSNVNQ